MRHVVTVQGTLRGSRKRSFVLGALLALGVVAFGAVGNSVSAHAMSSGGNGALKTPLTTANRGCDFQSDTPPGTGSGTGFVIIHKTGSGRLNANVVLVGARPNTTYNVRLIQTPTNVTNDCGSFLAGEATLTTDSEGNGQVNYQEPVLPGAHDAFVILNNANPLLAGTDFYTTQEELFF